MVIPPAAPTIGQEERSRNSCIRQKRCPKKRLPTPSSMAYTTYILLSGGLYATYHPFYGNQKKPLTSCLVNSKKPKTKTKINAPDW